MSDSAMILRPYTWYMQVDRLLEALEIWKNESDELREHEEECRLSGKEVNVC